MTEESVQRLRLQYKPDRVKILFVGESAPAGETFFYAENSILYSATRESFAQVFPDLREHHFLPLFRGWGCYLEDLCDRPVNKLSDLDRMQVRVQSVPALTEKLRQLAPQRIVVVMKDIVPCVQTAVEAAQLGIEIHALPFPRVEHRDKFIAALKKLITAFQEEGLLPASDNM